MKNISTLAAPQGCADSVQIADSNPDEQRPARAAVTNPLAVALNDLATETPPAEAEPPAPIDPTRQPLWELDPRFLDPFAELLPTQSWGRLPGDVHCWERQGIITLSAKRKQGKSTAMLALLSSLITRTPIDTFTPCGEPPRLVVIFDLEMNEQTLLRRYKPLLKTLGEQGRKLVVVPLLRTPRPGRRAVVEDIVRKYDPDIIAFDPVTKLMHDYNSSAESMDCCQWIEQLAATRTCVAIIHQNKSAEDANMKGHLGTLLGEAAVENYDVKRSGSVYAITAIDARNANPDDMQPINVVRNDDGTFDGAAQELQRLRDAERAAWRSNFERIFGDDTQLQHTELVKRLQSQEKKLRSAACEAIKRASDCGAIRKPTNDRTAPYELSPGA